MAYRTFLDDNGRYWQVWDSYPQAFDRRREERRKKSLSWPHGERRKTERRTNPESLTEQSHGWLSFESFSEKRRLSPIPPHWEELSVIELIELWKRAMQVGKLNGESAA